MKINQKYFEVMNQTLGEVLGESEVLEKDMSNVVDIGNKIINSTTVDNYVKSLINHIGKVIFVDRAYQGKMSSVMMDSWEYGSILQKISVQAPAVEADPAWNLQDGVSVDPYVFKRPKASYKLFNSTNPYMIPLSVTEEQVKESFSSAEQLNGFIASLFTAVENRMSVIYENEIRSTVNTFIGETIKESIGDIDPEVGFPTDKSSLRAVNLAHEYRKVNPEFKAEDALTDPEFIRFSVKRMKVIADQMGTMSRLFNIGGTEKFTPKDSLNIILHSEFKHSAEVYLQSDTYHNEFTALPTSETVPYWQGSGKDFDFESTSKINVKLPSGGSIEVSGIIGTFFDRNALGVANLRTHTASATNPLGEFTNFWFKTRAGFFNDYDENMVVFYVA